ncbi:MAG TPA: hypothetical protein VFG87_29535 [Amycolatopsis sp.]|jgi:hypothetical protein|nr:hypothetical protein [Amycolatopsis sp.]
MDLDVLVPRPRVQLVSVQEIPRRARSADQDDSVVQANLELPDEPLTTLCERTIRNHDPCISCSAHFLKLTVDRRWSPS